MVKGPFKKYVTLFCHFYDPPSPLWHFIFENNCFWHCEMKSKGNVFESQILLSNITFFLFSQTLKKSDFKTATEITWHFVVPPWVSRIIWMAPNHYENLKMVCSNDITSYILFIVPTFISNVTSYTNNSNGFCLNLGWGWRMFRLSVQAWTK